MKSVSNWILVVFFGACLLGSALPAAQAAVGKNPTFDRYVQSWLKAKKAGDLETLKSVFGEFPNAAQDQANQDLQAILNYESHTLHQSVTQPPDLSGEVSVSAYYLVRRTDGLYQILIIHGTYHETKQEAFIGSWQIFPVPEQTYATVAEAEGMIAMLAAS